METITQIEKIDLINFTSPAKLTARLMVLSKTFHNNFDMEFANVEFVKEYLIEVVKTNFIFTEGKEKFVALELFRFLMGNANNIFIKLIS